MTEERIGLFVNRYEFGLSVCAHEVQIYHTTSLWNILSLRAPSRALSAR